MKVLFIILRFLLKLRYKIEIHGVKHLKGNQPLLLLPNHVAFIDPVILIAFFSKYRSISPVASEKYYLQPLLKQIMDCTHTIPIKEVVKWNDKDDIFEVYNKIYDALKKNQSVLVYPSGQVYRQWFEVIRWKQWAYNIINMLDANVKVLWVRSRWLWWSMWSMAWDNGETGIFSLILKSFFILFTNLLFFIPKRKVDIEIEDITKEVYQHKIWGMNDLNRYLEDFYNFNEWWHKSYEEDVAYIKHYFFWNDIKNLTPPEYIRWSLRELALSQPCDISHIDSLVKKKICRQIAIMKDISIRRIHDTSNLVIDFYFDSLDLAEIKSFIQDTFQWSSHTPIHKLKTVSDLYLMAAWMSDSQDILQDCVWNDTRSHTPLAHGFRDTNHILLLWKKQFHKNKNQSFVWDNIFWMQSKKDFLLKAYLLSSYIRKMNWDYIGIMLPALTSSSVLIIATYLAGKIPVMFNWTLSEKAFRHCVNFSQVDCIITASHFYEKVKNKVLEEYHDGSYFVFLDELLKEIPLKKKLWALFSSYFMPIRVPWKSQKWQIAVLLFTSWSEALPKPVPLTHENLITNISGALDIFKLKKQDILLWFLPPFHSFWFTINTIMPLITGLKVVYTPDPNDATSILHILRHTKVTALSSTPTFLKMIMNLAVWNDFKFLKYAVLWAEKCSQEVFDHFQQLAPKWVILEWYGITECSPVISINPIEKIRLGSVGKIIPSLSYKIMSLDDIKKECHLWEQGMIYVSWPSVFSGYLDPDIESPFENIWWDLYFKTWDLWYVDAEGYLTITWRLKRFIKIAGEMVSLPFIEGVLSKKYWVWDELSFAIEWIEHDGKGEIVAFSTIFNDKDDMNAYLRSQGVANLIKIDEVKIVKEIPVLWTGKVDYKLLKKQIKW